MHSERRGPLGAFRYKPRPAGARQGSDRRQRRTDAASPPRGQRHFFRIGLFGRGRTTLRLSPARRLETGYSLSCETCQKRPALAGYAPASVVPRPARLGWRVNAPQRRGRPCSGPGSRPCKHRHHRHAARNTRPRRTGSRPYWRSSQTPDARDAGNAGAIIARFAR